MEELVYDYPLKKIKSFSYTKKEKQILRDLAEKKAEIATLSVHAEKIDMWKQLNSLKKVRPLVWINEIPWHEMDVDGELKLRTSSEFSRFLELRLRRTIYQWKHVRADMVVEPTLPCYLEINDTGFGISEEVSIVKTDEKSDIYSREFNAQIKSEEDIEKIKFPVITLDKKATDDKYERMIDIFHGILEIEKKGTPGFWFAPWDELIRWWGVQEALTDMILNPELIHKTMKRLTDAYIFKLEQYEELNLLSLNNSNYRTGSGGLGYVDELPQNDYKPNQIRPIDLWGSGAAQIFSNVSPKMHEEFALNYEICWMERFGLNYYGCCEPLDKKIEILERLPNLRKISMSPWVDLELGANNIGRNYVFSYKPNPAIFADDNWNSEVIKKELFENLKKIKNCNVEIILKDISTVRFKPQRLWEWAKIALEIAERIA